MLIPHAFMIAVVLASAAAPVPFTQAAFAAAQEAGKPIVLHFTALSCKVCEAQAKALERLLAQAPLSALVAFQADFDMSGDLAKAMRASRSTLIVFQGKKEAGREAGITTDGQIRELLRKALPEKRRGHAGPRPSNRTVPRP